MLFFKTKLRKKLLAHTFTHPDREFYVRELAHLISADPGNLSRELHKLEAEGLFKSAIKGNLKYYALNKRYPLFQELKRVIFKTEGVAGTLQQLVSGYKGIIKAFIYGSYAKEREKATSDVDLVIVGKFSQGEFTRQIRALELKLNREINFTSYTDEEFDREQSKGGSFLNMVVKDSFWLKGDPHA